MAVLKCKERFASKEAVEFPGSRKEERDRAFIPRFGIQRQSSKPGVSTEQARSS